MRDGYVEVPVTSRAAQAELERQEAKRRAAQLAIGQTGSDTIELDAPATNETGPERPHDAPTPMDS